MDRIKLISLVLLMTVLGAGVSHAEKVVVIPLGDEGISLSDCPSAPGNAIGGPTFLYGNCWYVSAGGFTCDQVCSAAAGLNLSEYAEDEWDDLKTSAGSSSCLHTDDDVTTWFYNNGNPGNWIDNAGSTSYHSLGYGYSGGNFYGKCTVGITASGAYPGEPNTSASRNLVCPCFGLVKP